MNKLICNKHVINFDALKSITTYWMALYDNDDNVTCFDSFGIKHIPRKIKKFIENKTITTNMPKIQGNDSIMCGYFCIRFIDFILKDKSLLDYANLFSLNEYEKNNKIILKFKTKNFFMNRF